MRTLVTCFILSAAAAWPQSPTPIVLPVLFPPQFKQYLAISDDQVARIGNVSQQIYTLEATRIQRQAQLQLEISQETAKPVPDPTALGTRYAELESIRRDLDALQKNLINQTQAILGADQKVKLATLQQALTLYPIACTAISVTLLSQPAVIGTPIPSIGAIYPVSTLLGGLVQGGCTVSGIATFVNSVPPPLPILPQP